MTLIDQPIIAGGVGAARPEVHVLTDRCAGCQECVIRCPAGALSMDSARWVAVADAAICVGCRQCVRTCPFSAILVSGPTLVEPRHDPVAHHELRLGDATEIRPGFADLGEAMAEAARCLNCPDPTCVRGCPAHNDIPGFVAALASGDVAGAAAVLARTSVMPEVCSRVCNQAAQCEGSCSWALAGAEPVAIGRLERFVADQAPLGPPSVPPERQDLSVAVVGAGPAGAGAAFELIEAGAEVTVYEADEAPGGLCRWGIPDFTLPEHLALRSWDQLVAAGVELRCGEAISPERLAQLHEEHDAVVVAIGAGAPVRRAVPGFELEGVTDATVFLKGAHGVLAGEQGQAAFLSSLGLSGDTPQARRVLVLGAGNTAMDVARSARRLGLEAVCVDWVDERFALARPDEIAEARAEGVEVRFLATLSRLEGRDGHVAGAVLSRTEQKEATKAPSIVEGAEDRLQVGLVVTATGYRLDPAFSGQLPGTPVRRVVHGVPDRHWSASGLLSPAAANATVGHLALGREAGLSASGLPVTDRVWVAGDALVGPSTVVEAMAQGRRAAQALIGARPRRPGRPGASGPKRVLVCYESQGGHTARAAEAVAAGLSPAASSVRTLPITKVGLAELAEADLIVMGTWVEGLVVAKVGPAKAMAAFLDALPRLGGKKVAIFCTYAVSPQGALAAMRATIEDKGATVIGEAAFGPRETIAKARGSAPAAFASSLVELADMRSGAPRG